jgi:nitrogen-specific signal transduction histidine kinase
MVAATARGGIPMNDSTGDPLNHTTTLDEAALPSTDAVLHGLREPVLVAAVDFAVGYANPAAERVLGMVPGDCVGRRLPELVPGRYSTPVPDAGRSWRFRRHAAGWIVYGTPAEQADGDWLQRVIEAEQLVAVGQLAAGVAHEIGAPLTAISVAVEYLIKSTAPDSARRPPRPGADPLPDAADLPPHPAPGGAGQARPSRSSSRRDLNAVVRESVALVQRQLRTTAVVCVTVLDGALPPVHGDAHHLQQVVLNLLLNAHRAVVSQPAVSNRRIEVRTSPPRRQRRADGVGHRARNRAGRPVPHLSPLLLGSGRAPGWG